MNTVAHSEKKFAEHLAELKTRLVYSALSIGVGAGLGYFMRDSIIKFLTLPLHESLYYTSPTGGFDLVFKISFLFGTLVSFPIVVYQVLKFIEPAIPQNFNGMLEKFLVGSWVLLLMGLATAYYLSLPSALRLLSEFSTDQVKALISTKDYMSFVLAYMGGFGLLFQLPIIMLLIHKITPLKPKKLIKYLRYVVLISFIVAAILTPTGDPINQTIMAMPIILLYTITIGIIALNPKPAYAQK